MNTPTFTATREEMQALFALVQETEKRTEEAERIVGASRQMGLPCPRDLVARCKANAEKAKAICAKYQQVPEVPHATTPPFCAPVPLAQVQTLREKIVAGMK